MGRESIIAESVVSAEYPRLELKTTVNVDGKDIKVYVVDGQHVRTYIDEEFTNFAQHYRFGFVPEFEFWLDKEGECDEANYFIAHLIVEWRLMRSGASYEEAIVEADKVERKIRLDDNDPSRVIDPIRKVVDPKLFRKSLLKVLENGVKVWLVNGCLVRTFLHTDFTNGGHPYVYEYVPPGDVWIDNDIDWQERGLVILHELHEMNRMAEGLSYEKAHAESSALELSCRKDMSLLHDALTEEGWA